MTQPGERSTEVSVVIPTYNREAGLGAVLAALAAQSYPADSFETVVVDDGSTDATAARLRESSPQLPFRTHWLRQENRGPAAARNAGLAAARGEMVVFLGDDTIPAADFVEQHVRYHERYNRDGKLAVVGYTRWPPELRATPFMRFAGEQGPQFGYAHMQPRTPLPYHRFYTSNLSFSRRLLEGIDYVFDEDFPLAMWEDAELGYRLSRQGMVLHYLPEAVAYHDHPTRISASYLRFREVGRMSRLMLAKHPELQPQIHGARKLRWISRLALPVRALVPLADVLDSVLRLPLPHALYWLILGEAYARGAVSSSVRAAAAPDVSHQNSGARRCSVT